MAEKRIKKNIVHVRYSIHLHAEPDPMDLAMASIVDRFLWKECMIERYPDGNMFSGLSYDTMIDYSIRYLEMVEAMMEGRDTRLPKSQRLCQRSPRGRGGNHGSEPTA